MPARCRPCPGEQRLGAGVLGARRSQRRLPLGVQSVVCSGSPGWKPAVAAAAQPLHVPKLGGRCPPSDAGCRRVMLSSPRAQLAQQMVRDGISSLLGCQGMESSTKQPSGRHKQVTPRHKPHSVPRAPHKWLSGGAFHPRFPYGAQSISAEPCYSLGKDAGTRQRCSSGWVQREQPPREKTLGRKAPARRCLRGDTPRAGL